jgi:hypothetical protein
MNDERHDFLDLATDVRKVDFCRRILFPYAQKYVGHAIKGDSMASWLNRKKIKKNFFEF